MRKVILALCVAGVLALCSGPVSAQISYFGTLAWDTCLNANDDWASTKTSISWTVGQQVPGGPWSYTYVLTVADDPEISHFILELTPGFDRNDFTNVDWLEDDLEFGTFGPGPSNPGFPEGCDFYGVKFDNVEAKSKTFFFETNIAPVWGDFYANGGATTRVFNDSICQADPDVPPADDTVNCKILRPDSVPTVIPEPSSAALALMGLLPALGYKLRRR